MLTRTALDGALFASVVALTCGCAAPLDDNLADTTGGAAGAPASGGATSGGGGSKATGGTGASSSGGNASGGGGGTTACSGDFADCDGQSANGCETTLSSDPWNCGACGVVCKVDHSSAKCEAGACVLACLPGWGDCDGDSKNGCESALTSADSCGACGVKCSGAGAHSSGACSSSGCVSQCDSGWADCDGSAGCETAVDSDPKNCGACGNDCGSQACVAGECQPNVVFDDSSSSPAGLALDANAVYFTDSYSDRVIKALKSGGPPVELATNTVGPYGIAVDSSFVYWASDSDEAVWKVPVNGGAQTKVAAIASGDTTAGLAVTSDYLYWLGGDQLRRTSLTTGATTSLAAATTPTSLSLFVDGNEAYWSSYWDQEVVAAPLGGGSLIVLANASYPNDIALDGKDVYYGDDNGLWRASKSGGAPSAVVSNSNGVLNLAVDGGNAYYSDGSSLFRVSLSGGTPVALHSVGSVSAIVVDSAFVYWTDSSAGQVLSLPK